MPVSPAAARDGGTAAGGFGSQARTRGGGELTARLEAEGCVRGRGGVEAATRPRAVPSVRGQRPVRWKTGGQCPNLGETGGNAQSFWTREKPCLRPGGQAARPNVCEEDERNFPHPRSSGDFVAERGEAQNRCPRGAGPRKLQRPRWGPEQCPTAGNAVRSRLVCKEENEVLNRRQPWRSCCPVLGDTCLDLGAPTGRPALPWVKTLPWMWEGCACSQQQGWKPGDPGPSRTEGQDPMAAPVTQGPRHRQPLTNGPTSAVCRSVGHPAPKLQGPRRDRCCTILCSV
ncbi:uncharacterized protein LOC120874117 [Oryx dammah]|uniref:uncharacterized protein LOC120874117 n=1 Tax=Oryx dammah TaxID=59534 RepID=UPI001A9BD9EC|nr:uncharacterized protein LOC120874117 [Oryx dammah]